MSVTLVTSIPFRRRTNRREDRQVQRAKLATVHSTTVLRSTVCGEAAQRNADSTMECWLYSFRSSDRRDFLQTLPPALILTIWRKGKRHENLHTP